MENLYFQLLLILKNSLNYNWLKHYIHELLGISCPAHRNTVFPEAFDFIFGAHLFISSPATVPTGIRLAHLAFDSAVLPAS